MFVANSRIYQFLTQNPAFKFQGDEIKEAVFKKKKKKRQLNHKLADSQKIQNCNFQSVVPKPGASAEASPAKLLQMRILCPHPRRTESETLGVEHRGNCFSKPSRRC